MNKPGSSTSEIEERLSALINNTSAIRAITAAVEGTIGPKGLDTMLVDQSGDIVITNAGVTILDRMHVTHPAARMMINIARSQHKEVGDGTTTATIMAGTMISEGLSHIMKGVPVAKVIEGIEFAAGLALEEFKKKTVHVDYPDDPKIRRVAMIAGRGNANVADNVIKAMKMVDRDALLDPNFKFSKIVEMSDRPGSEVFSGVALKKRPVNETMPENIKDAKILCLDDFLEADKPEEGSMRTEAGFNRYLKNQEEFLNRLENVINSGINVILLTRGVSDRAEQLLTDAGVLAVSRVPSYQMRKICRHVGATPIKKIALFRDVKDLGKYTGRAGEVVRDRKMKIYKFVDGAAHAAATYLVGAPTEEVAEEKERIAQDAASAVQAAVRGGVVAGGGAAELAISRAIAKKRSSVKGMKAFGVDCVIEALKTPISKILQNAGFNPLEKVEEVTAEQIENKNGNLGVDCDSGQIIDMMDVLIIDPTIVKLYALRAAAEVARAILRINIIIKMKDVFNGPGPGRPGINV